MTTATCCRRCGWCSVRIACPAWTTRCPHPRKCSVWRPRAAKTTPFEDTIGALEPGRAADIVLIDWRAISYPYLDSETPLLDAVLQRAKTGAVCSVICDGEVIYDDGRFTKVDRDGALRALHEDLQRALSDDEVERRQLSKSLLPHVREFYANYFDPEQHVPFYRQSSRR